MQTVPRQQVLGTCGLCKQAANRWSCDQREKEVGDGGRRRERGGEVIIGGGEEKEGKEAGDDDAQREEGTPAGGKSLGRCGTTHAQPNQTKPNQILLGSQLSTLDLPSSFFLASALFSSCRLTLSIDCHSFIHSKLCESHAYADLVSTQPDSNRLFVNSSGKTMIGRVSSGLA